MGWNVLITDSNGSSSRNKVVAKFTPKINILNTLKGNNGKSVDKPASINRLPFLIPVKSPKKVNEITKYFKINDQSKERIKSYAQVTASLINNIREVLKNKVL